MKERENKLKQSEKKDENLKIKLAEAYLELKYKLAEILDLLPDATFILDKDEKIIVWNRVMEELTNIKTKDMIGK